MTRSASYGENDQLTAIDRLGVWLSARQVRTRVGDVTGKRVGDFGCGFHGRLGLELAARAAHVTMVDVSLADHLKEHPKITAIEGALPDTMAKIPDASLDVTLCISVLEHLWEAQGMLDELRRVTAPGGVCALSVPGWLDKPFLEFTAFRMGIQPGEMDDHKRYYGIRDLWPMLRQAGFLPHAIKCRRYKLLTSVFAVCRVDSLTH
jgi:2-polyprenyl-6-hydroxyphenyl methylase/3-demethylubiquinone-9 3-methyltransferase